MNAPANALKWIAGGDTGLSSKAIWNHFVLGNAAQGEREANHPHDPGDFGRCHRLLVVVPEWRILLDQMANYSPEWAALVEHWDELEPLYLEYAAHPYTGKKGPGLTAWKKMYERMRELLDHARVCADCGKLGGRDTNAQDENLPMTDNKILYYNKGWGPDDRDART